MHTDETRITRFLSVKIRVHPWRGSGYHEAAQGWQLHRNVILGALTLALVCCSCSSFRGTAALPDLQQLSMANFLPAVRERVQKAYDDARAHPKDPQANGKLGMVLHAHDQLESATVCYQRARLLAPDNFQWVYYLALVQAAVGKNDEAAATFREALRLKPDYLPARLKLADALLAHTQWEEAGKIYEDILKEHPDLPAAHYGLGRVQQGRGDTAAAVERYRKACELFPAYGASHYALALAYRKLGDEEQAQKHFGLYEKTKLSGPPLEDPLRDAVRELNVAAAYYVRQGIELERAGQLEQAAAAHEKALEIDPQLVQAHVNLISLYGRLRQPEKAEQHYRAAVELTPNQAEAHYDYGVLLFGQGKYREAEQAFARALEINPFHPQAHNNLGFLKEQQGRLQEAIRHYRQALENQPDYRLAHFHLGRILVNQKNYREGIEHLLKTLTPEDESTPGYLYALASAYARAGHREAALRYARQARERAAALGQTQLLAGIERDIRILEGPAGRR